MHHPFLKIDNIKHFNSFEEGKKNILSAFTLFIETAISAKIFKINTKYTTLKIKDFSEQMPTRDENKKIKNIIPKLKQR